MFISFHPKYTFISTGDKTAFYTLREGGDLTVLVNNVYVTYFHTYHIQNLSTDRDTALTKGNEISEHLGLPFKPNADFDLNEIKRRSHEEAEAHRRAEIEAEEARRTEAAELYEAAKTDGLLLVGKYISKTAEEVAEIDPDYLYWMAAEADPEAVRFSKFNASALIAKKWADANPLPISEWVGEEGTKVEFEGRLTKTVDINGMYPTTLFRFVTEDGNVIIIYSTAKKMNELEAGDTVKILATVKKHDRSFYEPHGNNKVTVLNRPKVL